MKIRGMRIKVVSHPKDSPRLLSYCITVTVPDIVSL